MSAFRFIPSIELLRRRPSVQALEAQFGAHAIVDALRSSAAEVRVAISGGDATLASEDAVVARIEAVLTSRLEQGFRPSLRPVINATGVVLHTNLGRAPLASVAIDRIVEVAQGYSSLEYDLDTGARGRRDLHAEALLCQLTGAQAAVVVNNNAAATMLVLAALAAGREVIVSRGELVEIGGGFRVPDVMAQSGAVLREVGTTNKTRVADYGAAINDRTGLILRVHPSNFRIEGFTERPALVELVALGRTLQIPVAEDLGSGYLDLDQIGIESGSDRDQVSFTSEPTVHASVRAGIDVCCFSGDKLLGGPQAGIIVGRMDLIARIRTHPLMRALRVDKMTYAALEATLAEYAAGRATRTVPVQRMLTLTADEIRTRAEALTTAVAGLTGWRTDLVAGISAIGGGSAPGINLPTWLVAIAKDPLSAGALAARLRTRRTPIIARIESDRVLLDLRTVLPEQDAVLITLLADL